jgi:hypothetical protein
MLAKHIKGPLHSVPFYVYTRSKYRRCLQLCLGRRLAHVAAAAAAAATPLKQHDTSTAATNMHSQHAAPLNKTPLLTIGFADVAAEVLPSHTGWPLLQDRFHISHFPATTNDYLRLANESRKQAAAAIVAPVGQQLQIIQQLRAASATLFIACWYVSAGLAASVSQQLPPHL